MHPALVSAVAAAQRRDQITQAAATRRARWARRARRGHDLPGVPGGRPALAPRPAQSAALTGSRGGCVSC
jgi:hypothetical protein